jgi:O-antigen ligase
MRAGCREGGGGYLAERLVLVAVFCVTWLGFGDYMAGALFLAFVFALFFRQKRRVLFRDRLVLVLAAAFAVNSILSSLLSVDRTTSALLSALWFLVIFVPLSYAGFCTGRRNDFFERVILPASFAVSLVIVLYLVGVFLKNTAAEGVVFRRYTFLFLGEASTPDYLVMLGALGYGWLRQKQGERYRWYGLGYLVACLIGVGLAYDRGGVMAFFLVAVLLLAFDYKRLIVFLLLAGAAAAAVLQLEAFSSLRRIFDYLYAEGVQEQLRQSQQLSTFRQAWLMIKDHWLMGVGTNNYSTFAEHYGTGRGWSYAHNLVLQFWAENGLFGMLLALAIIGTVLYRWVVSVKRFRSRYVALGAGAAFAGIVIGNMTNSTIWIIKVALPFWLLGGVISGMYFTTRGGGEEGGAMENEPPRDEGST